MAWGDRLYRRFGPLAYADEENEYALKALCDAIGVMFDPIDELVSDTDDGLPGWAILLDVDRCPARYLPVLAQYVGVQLPITTPEAEARERIRNPAGFIRGTRQAIIAAAQRTLTGTKTVLLYERDGGNFYQLRVATWLSETPDAALTEAELRKEKPLGFVLTCETIVGGDYATLAATHADYAEVVSDFTDYADVVTDPSQT